MVKFTVQKLLVWGGGGGAPSHLRLLFCKIVYMDKYTFGLVLKGHLSCFAIQLKINNVAFRALSVLGLRPLFFAEVSAGACAEESE